LIRENLIFSTIDLTVFDRPSLEVLGIALTCDNESIAIINIYRHPNQHTPFVTFDQLFSAMLNNYSKVIFIGDFNAHHSWWGCDYEDSAGRILTHIIETHDLVTLNDRLPSIILHPKAKRSVTLHLHPTDSLINATRVQEQMQQVATISPLSRLSGVTSVPGMYFYIS